MNAITEVHVLVIEHPDEDAELYVFANYDSALGRAADEIAERLPERDSCEDDDWELEVYELLDDGDVEGAIVAWIENCDGGHEIHIENQPILDLQEGS